MHVTAFKLKFKASTEYWLRLLIENYYLIVILFYMLTFVYQNLPVGILCAIVMCIIFAGMILKYGIRPRGSVVSMLVAIYVIYCTATVVFYFVEKIPISVFIKSASNSLLPILFFWCGLKGYRFSNKRYLLAVSICGLTGILLLFLRPYWKHCNGHAGSSSNGLFCAAYYQYKRKRWENCLYFISGLYVFELSALCVDCSGIDNICSALLRFY